MRPAVALASLVTFAVAVWAAPYAFDALQTAKLDRQLGQWEARRPHRYTFTYSLGACECSGPSTIEVDVTGAAVDSVRYDDSVYSYDYDEVLAQAPTLEDLFESARAMMDPEARALLAAESYGVRYDREFGFPVSFRVQYDLESNPDGLQSWSVSEFAALER